MRETPPENRDDGIYSVRGADSLCKIVFNMTAAAAALTFVLGSMSKSDISEVETKAKHSSSVSEQIGLSNQTKFFASSVGSTIASLASLGVWMRHRRYFPELNENKKGKSGGDQDNEPPSFPSSDM